MTKSRVSVLLLVVAVCGCDQSPTAPSPVTPTPTPVKVDNITFRVVEPLIRGRNGPGIGEVKVVPVRGSDEEVKETAADGSVTFKGSLPLTVRIQKHGYITTEATVMRAGGEEVVFPNEWPPEVREAVHQLSLDEELASGEIILRWGEDEYMPARAQELGDEGFGGQLDCPVLLVRDWRERRDMVWTVVHELMGAWTTREATGEACDPEKSFFYGTDAGRLSLDKAWTQSEAGGAWMDALETDLEEFGPMPGFDDQVYGYGKLLSELPQASIRQHYPYWYMGWSGTRAELNEYCTVLAPNRCRYFRDRFGSSPR